MANELTQHPEQTIATPAAQPAEQQAITSATNQGAPGQGQAKLEQTKAQTDNMVASGALPDTQIIMSGAAATPSDAKAGTPGTGGAAAAATTGDAPANPAEITETYQMGDGMGTQKPNPFVSHFQTELNNLGYATGGADGQFGSQTKEGVTEFQKANNLPQNGELDPATQTALGDPNAKKNPNPDAPLTADQVKAEAQALEPYINQFLTSNNFNTQKTALEGYQKELQNVYTHGASSTNQVLDQIASDMKSNKSLDVEKGNVFGQPWLQIQNKDFVKGLSEDVPTMFGSGLVGNSAYTKGTDGDGDYDDHFEFTTTMSKGVPSTKENTYHWAGDSGISGGGGAGYSPSRSSSPSAPASPEVQVQNPDGSFGGTGELYPGGILIRNGDNPNP